MDWMFDDSFLHHESNSIATYLPHSRWVPEFCCNWNTQCISVLVSPVCRHICRSFARSHREQSRTPNTHKLKMQLVNAITRMLTMNEFFTYVCIRDDRKRFSAGPRTLARTGRTWLPQRQVCTCTAKFRGHRCPSRNPACCSRTGTDSQRSRDPVPGFFRRGSSRTSCPRRFCAAECFDLSMKTF